MAPVSNQSTNAFVPLVAGSTTETVKLQVFARSSTDISSAFDEIEKFIEDHLTSETLNHEKHYDVVLKHWDELKLLTKDHDLKITCLDPTTVLMEGVLSKVVEAKDKLTELVKKLIGSATSQGIAISQTSKIIARYTPYMSLNERIYTCSPGKLHLYPEPFHLKICILFRHKSLQLPRKLIRDPRDCSF